MALPKAKSAKGITEEEYLSLGEDVSAEIIEGEIIEMAPTKWQHGIIGKRLGTYLDLFVETRRLGIVNQDSVAFKLEEDTEGIKGARVPDLAFSSWERIDEHKDDFNIIPDWAPDLAVEIVSPNDRLLEVIHKMRYYLERGSLEVWLVLPDLREIHVYTSDNLSGQIFTAEDELISPKALPGFRLPVSALFATGKTDPSLFRRFIEPEESE